MTINNISTKVPREAIINRFGSIIAISPDIYDAMVSEMAKQYDVDKEELVAYIGEVLKSIPYID